LPFVGESGVGGSPSTFVYHLDLGSAEFNLVGLDNDKRRSKDGPLDCGVDLTWEWMRNPLKRLTVWGSCEDFRLRGI